MNAVPEESVNNRTRNSCVPNDGNADRESLIGRLDSENVEYFVMGDLNCDMIQRLAVEFLRP